MKNTTKIALVITLLFTLGFFGAIGVAIWYLPIPKWVRIILTTITVIRCISGMFFCIDETTKEL